MMESSQTAQLSLTFDRNIYLPDEEVRPEFQERQSWN
jgi:hypothetical protein